MGATSTIGITPTLTLVGVVVAPPPESSSEEPQATTGAAAARANTVRRERRVGVMGPPERREGPMRSSEWDRRGTRRGTGAANVTDIVNTCEHNLDDEIREAYIYGRGIALRRAARRPSGRGNDQRPACGRGR